jgi:hypothetical protein
MCIAVVVAAVVSVAGPAQAALYINEVLGSTSSNDWEFIEIYNSGPGSVDISGYEIELWDSDSGTQFGGSDGGSPYIVPGSTSIASGGFFLFANALASTGYSVTPDVSLGANAVENSSYTVILADGSGGSIVDSVFVTDGGAGDAANRAGASITPGATFGPDGSFLPAGFYRTTDGGGTLALLNFNTGDLNNGTSEGGTPGASNVIGGPAIPEPTTLLVFVGLLASSQLVRRRSNG